MFNRVTGHAAFSSRRFRPGERSAFLRLAWILRSDTGRLRAEFSGDGGVEKFCEGSCRGMQNFSRRLDLETMLVGSARPAPQLPTSSEHRDVDRCPLVFGCGKPCGECAKIRKISYGSYLFRSGKSSAQNLTQERDADGLISLSLLLIANQQIFQTLA